MIVEKEGFGLHRATAFQTSNFFGVGPTDLQKCLFMKHKTDMTAVSINVHYRVIGQECNLKRRRRFVAAAKQALTKTCRAYIYI